MCFTNFTHLLYFLEPELLTNMLTNLIDRFDSFLTKQVKLDLSLKIQSYISHASKQYHNLNISDEKVS